MLSLQNVIVAMAVLAAAGYLARYVYRLLSGKQSGCGSCGGDGCAKGAPQSEE